MEERVTLMYPHALDRWRLLQWLVKVARTTYPHPGGGPRGIDQASLARRARTSQTTISNLEHLEKAITMPQRKVGRDELLKVLIWGLALPRSRIDAILYLYDGRPLQPAELQHYLPS